MPSDFLQPPSRNFGAICSASFVAILVIIAVEFFLFRSIATVSFVFAYAILALLLFALFRWHDKSLATVFLLGFSVRIILLFVFRDFFLTLGMTEGSPAQSDPLTYAQVGWDYAFLWQYGEFEGTTELRGSLPLRHTYYAWNAAIFYVMGKAYFIVPVMINVLVCSVAAVVSGMCAGQMGASKAVVRMTAIMTAFDPHMIIFSTLNLKESWVSLFLFIGIWAFMKVGNSYRERSRSQLGRCTDMVSGFNRNVASLGFGRLFSFKTFLVAILFVGAFGGLYLMRSQLAALLLVGIVVEGLNLAASSLGVGLWQRVVVAFFIGVFALYGPHVYANKLQITLAAYEKSFSLSSLKPSQSLFSFLGGSLVQRPYIIPILVIVALLGAFPPWRTDATWISLLLRPGTIWLHLMLPFVFLGGYRIWKKQVELTWLPTIMTVLVGYLFAAVAITRGTPEFIRYFAPVHGVLWVFAALGLESAGQGMMSRILRLYPVVIGILAIVYYTAKFVVAS